VEMGDHFGGVGVGGVRGSHFLGSGGGV
jgi:hypothetical protein